MGDVSGTVRGTATLTEMTQVGIPFALLEFRAVGAGSPVAFSLWVIPIPPGRPGVGALGVFSEKGVVEGGLSNGVFAVASVRDGDTPAAAYASSR